MGPRRPEPDDDPSPRVLAGARGGGLLGAAAAAEEQPRGGEGVDGAGEAEEEREAGDPGHEEEADGEGDGAAEHERHRRAEEHGRGRGRGHRRHRLPRRRRGGGHDGEQQRAELADLPRVVLAAAAAAAGTRHARWVAGRKRSRGPRPFDSSRAVGRWISAQARRGRGDSRRGVRQEEAVNSDEAEEWKDSMGEEVSDLLRMEVFEEVDLPVPKEKVLGVKWVLVNKRNQAGEFIRKKSRLVAQGFRQIHGVNYKETFAPTPTFAALRAALTMAAKNGWDTVTFDVKTAFLHSDIDEELYIKDPPGYKVTPGKILKLKKSLYGTKQAGRCWWIHLKGALERIGFISNAEDRSTYSYVGDDGQAFLWVHVDDGLLTVSLGELKQRLMAELDKSLTLKWDAGIESIVGIQIDRTPTGFNLHQPALIRKLRDLEPMALPAKTPLVDTGLFSNISHGADSDYLRRIGVLLYIAQGSRPDICFAVHYLARFSLNLDDTHWTALRRLIGYTLATADFKLKIEPDGSKAHPLKTYVDANWGGEGARATHGYISTLWGTPIAWNAKRQTCVARSTCQAEYVALSLAAMESVWLRNLIAPFEKEMTPLILSDNKSAVKIAGDKSSMKRTRHIDREFHFINEQLCKNEASLQWISGSDQLADGFTKALGAVNHTKLSTWLFGKLP